MKHVTVILVLLLMISDRASAQPSNQENHYKARTVDFNASAFRSVALTDQWGEIRLATFTLDRYATPAGVDGGGWVDGRVHQTWWQLPHGSGSDERLVGIENEIGKQNWIVREPRYLVAPATYWEPTPLEYPWNYYLCYGAEGPTMTVTLTINDVFESGTSTVAVPAEFCNPVEMRDLTLGNDYPVVEPDVRLACYDVNIAAVGSLFIVTVDVFGGWFFRAQNSSKVVCFPSNEVQIVATEESSWGKLKALYDR